LGHNIRLPPTFHMTLPSRAHAQDHFVSLRQKTCSGRSCHLSLCTATAWERSSRRQRNPSRLHRQSTWTDAQPRLHRLAYGCAYQRRRRLWRRIRRVVDLAKYAQYRRGWTGATRVATRATLHAATCQTVPECAGLEPYAVVTARRLATNPLVSQLRRSSALSADQMENEGYLYSRAISRCLGCERAQSL
jgi:hypothetical protein